MVVQCKNSVEKLFKMQKVKSRLCYTNHLNRKNNEKGLPSDLDQEKIETCMHKLDKLGEEMPSLSRKKVLDRNTFTRLKNEAVVISDKERRAAADLRLLNEERLKNESVIRKTELQKYDSVYTTKGPKLAQVITIILKQPQKNAITVHQ